MARILGLDYGQKRTGIAVTDPLQIIASPLTTIETKMLIPHLDQYFKSEKVEAIVIGYPTNLDGSPTDNTERVEKFIERFKRIFSHIPIYMIDESYTSKEASKVLFDAGIKKSQRQIKGNIDKVSAAIILKQYLESIQ